MRKVKPENEIPSFFLTQEAQDDRIARLKNSFKQPETILEIDSIHSLIRRNELTGMSDQDILAKLIKVSDIIMNNEISKYSVCRPGCSACCKPSIDVTQAEAQWISKHTGRMHTKLMNSAIITDGSRLEYCPFHDSKTATCSIYEYRPLVCRFYSTIDHYRHCSSHNAEHITTSLSTPGPTINSVYHFLVSRSLDREHQGKGAAIADIRNWFPAM
jgi:uncharacterized protein